MYSEPPPPGPPTFYFGEFRGPARLCCLCPCWTGQVRLAVAPGPGAGAGPLASGPREELALLVGGVWGAFLAPVSGCPFSQGLLQQPPPRSRTWGCEARCHFGRAEASPGQRLCPVVWPRTTLVFSFFFFREQGFPLVEAQNLPLGPLVLCSQPGWHCWLMSWFDSLSSFILGPS